MTEHPWGLTPTEWEVVKRICAGCNTRRKIAAALRISDRTVGSHLSNIFRKLRIHNRPALILKVQNDPIAREMCFTAIQTAGVSMLKLTLYATNSVDERSSILVLPAAIESVRPVALRREGRHSYHTMVRTRSGDEIAVCESVAEIQQMLMAADSHRQIE